MVRAMDAASHGATSLRRFAPILAVQLIGTLGYSIALPFLVFLVRDLGGAAWTYGLVGATYSACQLVGAPLLGRWSDRAGRRPVLLASQAGTLVAWLLFLVALASPRTSLGEVGGAELTLPLLLIFAARALDGLTGGNVSVANAYVADMTQGEEVSRRLAFGRMGMAASLGFVLGPAIAGVLGAFLEGYWAPVLAATVISAVATFLCAGLKEPPGRCPHGPEAPPAVSRVIGQEHRRCDRAPPPRNLQILKRPAVAALLASTFIQFLAFNFFYAGFPVHADTTLGWSPGRMGAFFAIMSGAMILAQGPLLGLLTGRWSAHRVFFVGALGLVASFALLALPGGFAPFLGALLFAIGNGLAWPTFQARIADSAEPEAQGVVQGATTSAGALASIAGLVVGGMIYPVVGVGLFVMSALLFLGVACGTPVWFGRREMAGA